MTTTQTDEIKTWQQRLEETCPALGPMHIHACVEEVNDAMQAEINDLRAALQEQAREGEAVAWSDDALNRAYSDGVAYGERNYRQAIATYQAEASGYKDAYFKLVESIANLKVFEPAPPIIIAAPQPAQPSDIGIPITQPVAQPLTDDPLQGAVDWLLQADGEYFCVATVQRTLRIGYNRAKRLADVAKERAIEAAHGIGGAL